MLTNNGLKTTVFQAPVARASSLRANADDRLKRQKYMCRIIPLQGELRSSVMLLVMLRIRTRIERCHKLWSSR